MFLPRPFAATSVGAPLLRGRQRPFARERALDELALDDLAGAAVVVAMDGDPRSIRRLTRAAVAVLGEFALARVAGLYPGGRPPRRLVTLALHGSLNLLCQGRGRSPRRSPNSLGPQSFVLSQTVLPRLSRNMRHSLSQSPLVSKTGGCRFESCRPCWDPALFGPASCLSSCPSCCLIGSGAVVDADDREPQAPLPRASSASSTPARSRLHLRHPEVR